PTASVRPTSACAPAASPPSAPSTAVPRIYYGDSALNEALLRRVVPTGLGAALAGCEGAPGEPLQTRGEGLVAERTAGAFRGPQPRQCVLVPRLGKKFAERREALEHRAERRQPVVPSIEVRAHARPAPVLGACHQACPHRVQRNVADGGGQVLLVHRHRS